MRDGINNVYRFLSLILIFLTNLAAVAKVEWLAKEYDFGQVKEENGAVTGSVKFVNKGSKATFINRVRPSCGCTGASYTTSMIEPGDTATITFTFNPMGRPGTINKAVKVYIGEDNDMTVIHLSGTVMASAETLDTRYPVECGPLRLENTILPIGELVMGVSRHVYLNVYNQGDKPIRPWWEKDEKELTVSLIPEELGPGENGTFSFRLTTKDMNEEGRIEIPVDIWGDEKNKQEFITVTLTGTVVKDKKASFGEENKGKKK